MFCLSLFSSHFQRTVGKIIIYKVYTYINCYYFYKTIYEKPKVSIQIIKNAKGLNTNNPKSKKKQVQTNKRTLILYAPMTFLKGTETMYQIKTKRVLITKEQKTDTKKKKT